MRLIAIALLAIALVGCQTDEAFQKFHECRAEVRSDDTLTEEQKKEAVKVCHDWAYGNGDD